ncbi:GNAT family N-acetyltransferase [Herbiconiux sp. SALV-R1]|uniref:GNAT family N-acetyltransferase n=2 Tax=unclassified Herbiconiux TaxID=2618217 RepID=UPI0020A505B7|nr:GNAT family N-acetyltransferase [Herbiconiux sp. SALV-R1]
MGEGDLDAMAGLLGDARVMTYYPAPKTREGAAAWIAWNRRNYDTHGFGLWIVETREGEFVGDCGLTVQEVAGSPAVEVGYHVRPALQGRGYATEAAAACLEFAKDHMSADRVVAIIHPQNRASERVAEKIGMTRLTDEGSGDARRIVLGVTLHRP